jgi:hypothetical protein
MCRLRHTKPWVAGDARAGALHPLDGDGVVADDDVGFLPAEPAEKLVALVTLHDQGRERLDGRVAFLEGAEGGAPAVLQALVLVFLQVESGAVVAAGGEALQGGEQRAVLVGADGVEFGPLDDVVGVDAGVAGTSRGRRGPARPRWAAGRSR